MGRILITIDHKWRDLPGNTYLGHLLRQRGHKVFFTRNGMEQSAACHYRPDVIVLNNLYSKKRQGLAHRLSSFGCAIFILPTEGIATSKEYRTFLAGNRDTFEHVDLHSVWGEDARDLTLEMKSLPERKIVVTGVPRFDFYRPPLRQSLLPRRDFAAKYGLDANRPILTFSTNYAMAGYNRPGRYESYCRDYQRQGLDKGLPRLLELPRLDEESRSHFQRAFLGLCRVLSNINLVLRPHPSEEESFFHSLFDEAAALCSHRGVRLALVRQEYIWDILANTDILVKRSCTTGVEAWALDRPTIEFRLNPDEWYYSAEYASGSDEARSFDELLALIRHYLAGGAIPAELIAKRREFIRRFCYRLDGQSTPRVVEAIHGLLQSRPPACYPSDSFVVLKSLQYSLEHAADYFASDLLHYRFGKMDLYGRPDKWIHDRDVRRWEGHFDSILGGRQPLNARNLEAPAT